MESSKDIATVTYDANQIKEAQRLGFPLDGPGLARCGSLPLGQLVQSPSPVVPNGETGMAGRRQCPALALAPSGDFLQKLKEGGTTG